MKEKLKSQIFQDIAKSLPERFVNGLIERHRPIYEEAYESCFNNPALDEPEAEYLRPHKKRALYERVFRHLALDSGLKATVERNTARNHKYTLVSAGKFLITASYNNSPSQMVRPGKFRKQHACVNWRVSQQVMYFIPGKDLYGTGGIYAILLHGPDAENPKLPGFLKLSIPSEGYNHWIEQFDLRDIREAQVERRQGADQDSGVQPTWKKWPRISGGDEGNQS